MYFTTAKLWFSGQHSCFLFAGGGSDVQISGIRTAGFSWFSRQTPGQYIKLDKHKFLSYIYNSKFRNNPIIRRCTFWATWQFTSFWYQDRHCTCKSNIEARSPNHCCRGIAISITYCECVSVAVVTQDARRMRCAMLPSVACLALTYFFHIIS